MRVIVRLTLAFVLLYCPASLILPAGASEAEVTLLIAPEYFAVSGVASGDVLNIRAQPDPQAEIVGTLAPGASPVEIIAVTAGPSPWGQVIAGDGSGWVSMAYLTPADPARVPDTPIPLGTVCTGTEPFWSLTFTTQATLSFETPDAAQVALPLGRSGSFVARPHRFYALAGGGDDSISAVISSAEFCSDGMSDRDYGWSVDFLRTVGGEISGYSGCCARSPAP